MYIHIITTLEHRKFQIMESFEPLPDYELTMASKKIKHDTYVSNICIGGYQRYV